MSQRAPIITASGENPDFIDHCGRSILYGSCGGRIESMVIETVYLSLSWSPVGL
jgi:hypothetical protein